MKYSREQEYQLISDILNGQRDKYEILVDRYASMVFHVVRRFINDEDEVEELAQEIFVKTYERLDSFGEEAQFSSWLYMIAKNHCRDFVKNIRRENRSLSEFNADELHSHTEAFENPGQEIERLELKQLLKKGLEAINSDYAEAFLLKYKEDMTYKAMSTRLDVSVSALKVRVHRAKKALKEFIEQNS